MKNTVLVGFDRQVLTPEESIPLTGFGNESVRFHRAVTEDICATCIAITDENDSTVLLVTADFVSISAAVGETVRERIHQATGICRERIIVAGTHSHSAPAVGFDEYPQIRRYSEMCWQKIALAAQNAMADRKPSCLYIGSVETKELNFVRHYTAYDLTTGKLSWLGDLFGTEQGKRLMDHATVADPTLHLAQFKREGGKDVVIANFRAHPHFTGGTEKYDMSSDFVGAFRMALEAMGEYCVAYFQGASGNINEKSRMNGERTFSTCRAHGTALAAYAIECLERCMRPARGSTVKAAQKIFKAQLYIAPEELVEPAKAIHECWKTEYDQEKCIKMGKPYGIRSQYHAWAIIRSQSFTPERGYLTINAVSVGEDFALVTYPGELFDSCGVRMEENSPYAMTMLFGYCHHHTFYLPSAAAFKYTSYETDCTFFQPGTGEQVADFQVQMLKELKNG